MSQEFKVGDLVAVFSRNMETGAPDRIKKIVKVGKRFITLEDKTEWLVRTHKLRHSGVRDYAHIVPATTELIELNKRYVQAAKIRNYALRLSTVRIKDLMQVKEKKLCRVFEALVDILVTTPKL